MKLHRYKEQHRAESGGFTLPEVMVSILLTTIMVTSLYAGITSTYKIAHQTRDVARATQLMVDTMEIMRLYTWEELNTPGFVPGNFNAVLDGDYRKETSADGQPKTLEQYGSSGTRTANATVTIADASFTSSYSTNIKEITIVVTWENGGLQQVREMKTLVARNRIQSYIY